MRKLIQKYEVMDFLENGEMAYKRTVVVWEENGSHFQNDSVERSALSKEIDLSTLTGTRLRTELLKWKWDSSLLEAPSPWPSYTYIKRPSILEFNEDAIGFLGQNLLAEAHIYQRMLSMGSHPNICTYYGALKEDGNFVGLVLERYPHAYVSNAPERYPGVAWDRRSYLAAVVEGVKVATPCARPGH